MAEIDGVAAAQTLLSYRGIDPGLCLMYVWRAYAAHGARADRSYPTAYAGWFGSPGKHEGDWNPPAGAAVWFGPRAGSAAGDVVISLGGGRVACTDYPVWGRTGSCTIAERQAQIGRPYLGWTETILGARIDLGAVSSVDSEPVAPPAPPKKRRKRMATLIEIVGSPADAPAGARTGDVLLETDEGESLVPDMIALGVIQRALAWDPESGKPIPLLSAERDLYRTQLAACRAEGEQKSALIDEVRRIAASLPVR